MIFYIRINSVLHSLMGNTKRMSDTQHSRVTQNSVTTLKLPGIYLFMSFSLPPTLTTTVLFYYYYTFALPRMLYSWNLTVHAYHFFSFLHTIFFLSLLPTFKVQLKNYLIMYSTHLQFPFFPFSSY